MKGKIRLFFFVVFLTPSVVFAYIATERHLYDSGNEKSTIPMIVDYEKPKSSTKTSVQISEIINIAKTLEEVILSYYPSWKIENLSNNPHITKSNITAIPSKSLSRLKINRRDLLLQIFSSLNKEGQSNIGFLLEEENKKIFIIDTVRR